MLFSELLKFSKIKFFKQQKFEKENIEIFISLCGNENFKIKELFDRHVLKLYCTRNG
jgi:hypothetical protein